MLSKAYISAVLSQKKKELALSLVLSRIPDVLSLKEKLNHVDTHLS